MSYTTTDGNSFFYSIQAKYEYRFSRGFNLLAAYTWGRVKDDVSDVLFSTLSYRAPYIPGFGIQGDYGLANFDVHNAVHVSGGYELPVGKGKRFLSGGGWTNVVAVGWRIALPGRRCKAELRLYDWLHDRHLRQRLSGMRCASGAGPRSLCRRSHSGALAQRGGLRQSCRGKDGRANRLVSTGRGAYASGGSPISPRRYHAGKLYGGLPKARTYRVSR